MDKDVDFGLYCIKKAVKEKNTIASHYLGYLMYYGSDIKNNYFEKDKLQGINFLEISANYGNIFAQYDLACIERNVNGDKNLFFKRLEKAANGGIHYAQYELEKVFGKRTDKEGNLKFWEKGIESKLAISAIDLSKIYYYAYPVKKDQLEENESFYKQLKHNKDHSSAEEFFMSLLFDIDLEDQDSYDFVEKYMLKKFGLDYYSIVNEISHDMNDSMCVGFYDFDLYEFSKDINRTAYHALKNKVLIHKMVIAFLCIGNDCMDNYYTIIIFKVIIIKKIFDYKIQIFDYNSISFDLLINICIFREYKRETEDDIKNPVYLERVIPFLKIWGFSDQVCDICRKSSVFIDETKHIESFIISLVDIFCELLLDNHKRKGYSVDRALGYIILKIVHRNEIEKKVKDLFVDFVVEYDSLSLNYNEIYVEDIIL